MGVTVHLLLYSGETMEVDVTGGEPAACAGGVEDGEHTAAAAAAGTEGTVADEKTRDQTPGSEFPDDAADIRGVAGDRLRQRGRRASARLTLQTAFDELDGEQEGDEGVSVSAVGGVGGAGGAPVDAGSGGSLAAVQAALPQPRRRVQLAFRCVMRSAGLELEAMASVFLEYPVRPPVFRVVALRPLQPGPAAAAIAAHAAKGTATTLRTLLAVPAGLPLGPAAANHVFWLEKQVWPCCVRVLHDAG